MRRPPAVGLHVGAGELMKDPGQPELTATQIGRCGELLVQFRLLAHGIESAPMSTDTGIDLVAYSPAKKRPVTIQVKTNLRAKPGGGRGKPALDWWIPAESPAHFFAFVDLSTERVWLFSRSQLQSHAQQRSSGRLHLYMYTDSTAKPKKTDRFSLAVEFETFLLANRLRSVFGV